MIYDLDKLNYCISQDYTLKQIGAEFGVSAEAIRLLCKRLGIKRKKQTVNHSNPSHLIAYNKSEKGRLKTIELNKDRRFQMDNEKIRQMYEDGRSMMYIANYFDVSEHVIRRRLEEMNVKSRDANAWRYI